MKKKKSSIGVKELKNKATQVVRAVHEKNAEFVITLDGLPVAVIKPIDKENAKELKLQRLEAYVQGLKLAKTISKQWQDDLDAVATTREQRRDL